MDSGLYLTNLAKWKGNRQAYIYGKHSIKVYWATFGSNEPCWKCRDWRNCWNNIEFAKHDKEVVDKKKIQLQRVVIKW